MNRYTKEQLAEQAKKFMEAENIDSFLATEDGNFFHPKDKNLAKDHNAKNVKGELFVFKKEDLEESPATPVVDNTPTEHETKVAAVKNAIAEMQGLGITDVKEIRGRLGKADFDKDIINEVLNEMTTHE